MPARDEAGQRLDQDVEELMAELRLGLHDLCQPLSALQCRLYLGALDEDLDSMRAAIAESLTECDRMVAEVRALQDRLRT